MVTKEPASFVEILESGFFSKRSGCVPLREGRLRNQASFVPERTSFLYIAAMREIPITGANKMLMTIPRSELTRDMRPRRTPNDIDRAIEARK